MSTKQSEERGPSAVSAEGPAESWPGAAQSIFTEPLTRRRLLASSGLLAGGAVALSAFRAPAAEMTMPHGGGEEAKAPAEHHSSTRLPGLDYQPVVVPNGKKLPSKMVIGVRVFHLITEEVEHEFAPGLKATCWGYNGSVHGPLIEAVEGDRVRIYVTNRLAAATTVHWHGILLPNGMDGVGGLNQKAIPPGETYRYEFTLRQAGTGMYHSHHDEMTPIGMGMTGMIVIHPRRPNGPHIDRDFAILLHEWRVDVGARRPNPFEMTDFNLLTMNAKAFPGTEALVVRKGQRVRIRIGNLSPMSHHPIHLHGYHFRVTETGGRQIPQAGQSLDATVLVPVGSIRAIEFVADEPGDWAMHCHMTHHVMNQMGHQFRNMVGVDTKDLDAKVQTLLPNYMAMGQTGMGDMAMNMGVPPNSIPMMGAQGKHDYITMGGMFTVLKVRDHLASLRGPGLVREPEGNPSSSCHAGRADA